MAPDPCGLLILLCFLGISTGEKKKKSHEACPALEVLVLSLPWGGLVGERGCMRAGRAGRAPLARVLYTDEKWETLVIRIFHSPLGT